MKAGDTSRAPWRRPGRPRYDGALTPRQQDVLELLDRGLTNEEIAQHLGITPDGVKYHVSEILQRLDVESRHDAVAFYRRNASTRRLAAWTPAMFLRKIRFAWLPKAAAGALLTAVAAGLALLAWGVLTTSTGEVITTGCSVEQSSGAPPCAPAVAQAASGNSGEISDGAAHTCAVKDGGAWCWGQNLFGVLGDNSTTDSAVPVAVRELTSGVSSISAGWYHTCAVKDGGAWCWGLSRDSRSGSPGVTANLAPVAVAGLGSGVSAISAGYYHTCALKDGGVWCWGANEAGQLGNSGTTDSDVPVAVSGLESGVSAISAGKLFSCAVKDGGAWCWGNNGEGQLGNNSTTDSPLPVAASGLTSSVSAISAGESDACAVKDGGVWCWGGYFPDVEIRWGSVVPVKASALGSGVSAISAGPRHTCAVKDGGVWCWLDNNPDAGLLPDFGPVAVSELPTGVSAISAGYRRSCALKDGGLWCWRYSELGESGPIFPVDVPHNTDVAPPPSRTSSDSGDHRGAFMLGGTAAAALAIVAAGMWAVRRARRSRGAGDGVDVWRNPDA